MLLLMGLFFMGLGISITAQSNLGTSPISSAAYVLSRFLPLSFGQFSFCFSVLFLLLEMVILWKECNLPILLQILICPLFGYFIDLGMTLTQSLVPTSYAAQFAELIIGCGLVALGILLQVKANVLMNPGEGLVKAIADRFRIKFGTIKSCFDSTLVLIALVISLAALHGFEGIREGTLISAVLVGYMTKWLDRLLGLLRPVAA